MNLYDEDDDYEPPPVPIMGMVAIMLALLAIAIAPVLCHGAEVEFPAGVYPGQSVKPVTLRDDMTVKALPHKAVSGLHSHWCQACKVEWWHGADQFANEASHHCPRCKSLVWEVHDEKAPAKLTIPAKVIQQASPCPNGICPLPTRRGRR